MELVNTNKTYFGGWKWNDRRLSFNAGIQQFLSHKLQIPKKNGQKIQNQIGLILALSAHI